MLALAAGDRTTALDYLAARRSAYADIVLNKDNKPDDKLAADSRFWSDQYERAVSGPNFHAPP